MPKGDYFFPLFYQKFLTSTTGWKDEEVGAYLRLLIYQYDKGSIPSDMKSLSRIGTSVKKNWPFLKKKFIKNGEGNLINSVMDAIREKRLEVSANLSKNGKKGGRPPNENETKRKPEGSQSHNQHYMVNGYSVLDILNQLESIEQVKESEIEIFLMLILKMFEIFQMKNPEYFFHKETDYRALLQIAYNIADMKKWTRQSVVDNKKDACLKSWETIVAFIKQDDWANSRSLTDLSTVKEWQRLVQKMSKDGIKTGKNNTHKPVITGTAKGAGKF